MISWTDLGWLQARLLPAHEMNCLHWMKLEQLQTEKLVIRQHLSYPYKRNIWIDSGPLHIWARVQGLNLQFFREFETWSSPAFIQTQTIDRLNSIQALNTLSEWNVDLNERVCVRGSPQWEGSFQRNHKMTKLRKFHGLLLKSQITFIDSGKILTLKAKSRIVANNKK